MAMMKPAAFAFLGASALMAGCVQQSAEPVVQAEAQSPASEAAPASPKLAAPFKTVKPGASVSFSHTVTTPINAGENGAVTFTLHEGYPSGVLHLEAVGDDGLNVFGAEVTTQKDMSSGTTHTWRVDFMAETDGLYYLKIYAMAEPDAGFSEGRAYSARIEVGDWQAAQSKVQAATVLKAMESGETAVVLEAQETIE